MEIPKDYPLVLTSAAAITIHCFFQAGAVSKMRKKIFNKEFMTQHFADVHRN